MALSKGGREPTPPAELAKLTGRERVYVFTHGDKETLATVLSRGDNVSMVRFDRADLFGKDAYIGNKLLHPTEEKK
jgi:hypothetical protein